MSNYSVRFFFFFLAILPTLASAAPLDDYYLSKFGEQARLAKAMSAMVGLEAEPSDRCRTHLYRSLKRDFSSLEASTQKTLGKYVSRPILSGQVSDISAPVFNSPGGHFAIHYTTSGLDAPNLTDADNDQVPDWVERVAAVFDEVYAYEVTTLGYRPPPVGRYDVYLKSLTSEEAYGFTAFDDAPTYPAVSVGSYIEIDSSFTDPMFTVNGRYTPDQMLQITAAHEFHHAIQFGYNYYFDIWYGEVTSTWMEDEMYDPVNQCYGYLARYLPLAGSISLNAGLGNNSEYGRWIFNRYLAERHAGVVRTAWEKLATLHPSTSPATITGDIQMAPVLDSVLSSSYGSSLASDFFGFAKRAYVRDWATHNADLALIPNHVVKASYSSYPVTSASSAIPSVTLHPYTYVFYRFVPQASVADLSVSVTKSSGIQTALFKKSGGVISEVAANNDGSSYTVNGFGSLNSTSDEVVLLVANTSGVDGHQANFSTDGAPAASKEPGSVASVGGGGGGGGGCFIATAAYGSYLHPKVAELRSFRDRYLMTNAPGRFFVSLYYRVSPPIAEVISQHEWMKAGVRVLLLPLVLSVEHPVAAAALLLLALGSAAWRVARRGRGVQLRRLSA